MVCCELFKSVVHVPKTTIKSKGKTELILKNLHKIFESKLFCDEVFHEDTTECVQTHAIVNIHTKCKLNLNKSNIYSILYHCIKYKPGMLCLVDYYLLVCLVVSSEKVAFGIFLNYSPKQTRPKDSTL